MIEMPIFFFVLLLVGMAFAGASFMAAYLLPKVQKWRIRWIELEHDSARAEGREPRNIDSVS